MIKGSFVVYIQHTSRNLQFTWFTIKIIRFFFFYYYTYTYIFSFYNSTYVFWILNPYHCSNWESVILKDDSIRRSLVSRGWYLPNHLYIDRPGKSILILESTSSRNIIFIEFIATTGLMLKITYCTGLCQR